MMYKYAWHEMFSYPFLLLFKKYQAVFFYECQ